MDFLEFTTGTDDNDRRIDKVIRKFLPETKLSDIYKAIRKGLIKINGKKCKEDSKILCGDKITIAKVLTLNNSIKNENQKIDQDLISKLPPVIFTNEHYIIFNKPYGMLVQPSSTNELSLDKILKEYYKTINHSNSLSFTPGPLHRLDKNTTGIIVCSLSLEGARWFSENINNHSVQKKYLGIIQGCLKNKEIWKDKITKDGQKNNFYTVKAIESDDNNAWTEITPLKYGKYKNKDVTLAEFHIKTGKTHQIRAQSSLHSYPLLGDTIYNAEKIDNNQNYFLHAYKLIINENPVKLPFEINAELPSEFKTILKTCDINIYEV